MTSSASVNTPLPRSLKRSRSLADEVVEIVSNRIYDGSYAPGTQLPTESALMGETGVSRTVIREALSRLQASQLVETRHGIGTFVLDASRNSVLQVNRVSLPTLLDVLAIMEVRLSLETEAAGLAALRRTDQHLAVMRKSLNAFKAAIGKPNDNAVNPDVAFHEEIAKATGNRYFIDMLHQLGNAIIPRTRVSAVPSDAKKSDAYLTKVNNEHERILTAIRQQNVDAARTAMRNHLNNSRLRLQRILDSKIDAKAQI
jgi:GntR family transcriptional repressor for pyruvate dehydrogenase complex